MSKFINTNTKTVNIQEDPDFPYNPPCMRCQPIIEYTGIQFHESLNPDPLDLFDDKDWRFGIFNLYIRTEIPITTKHVHIFFTIDGSGSMSDMCADNRSKMQHIHFTLENMLRMFHENPDCNISIHVQSFDTKIKKHIENVSNIREENLEDILKKIKKIRPGGSTNIELALNSACNHINNYKINNPEHEIVHLFLTDGEVTDGSHQKDVLKSLVPNNCENIFIGYGLQHDSELLSFLGNTKDNEYRFIDALEKAGLVYGEIVHGILYKAITDVTIKPYGCEIYDYQTNTWSDELMIGNLLSEQKKTYHLRSKNPEQCSVAVLGKTIIKTKQYQIMTDDIEEQTRCSPIMSLLNTNLITYVFRQRTQELLYEARKLSENIKKMDSLGFLPHDLLELPKDFDKREEKNTMKSKLNSFRSLMLKYMNENQMESDPIIKMLCDDIYICYKTLGTSIGNMFTCARQTSQGRQQTYACSAVEGIPNNQRSNSHRVRRNMCVLPIPRLVRQTNSVEPDELDPMYELDELDEMDEIGLLSQDVLTPYSTDTVVTMMREVSGNNELEITQRIH
jgi:von Willebrand factor type A domain